MIKHTPRTINLAIFVVCLTLLGFGFYLQYVEGLEPCILCMVQRLSFVLVGITTLLAFIINPGGFGVRAFAALTGIFAGLGAATAARQIWLQHLPADKVPECGPDLYYMLESYPITETLVEIFSGSGECAKVSWRFLGFSIPEWAIVIFICIFSVSASIFIQHQSPKSVTKSAPDS